MDGFPEMCVLGYQPTRPRLRLLHLPEEVVEPSPVPLDATVAISRGFVRDGWLVFDAGTDIRGISFPLKGRPFRVGRWWDCVPGPNPRTIWLANPVGVDESLDRAGPTIVVEYDGVQRAELVRHELPSTLRLEAALADGLVLREVDPDEGPPSDGLSLWPGGGNHLAPLAAGTNVVACCDPVLAVSHGRDAITLVNVTTGIETPVPKPAAGNWDQFGSFSPDGKWFAIGISEEPRAAWHATRMPEDMIPPTSGDVGDWFAGRLSDPDYLADTEVVTRRLKEPRWSRLALVDCASGAVTLSDGRFDNFASAPVWTADGSWALFDAPFDKSLFACDVRASPPRLIPILRRRGRPVPLLDVTAILQ